MKTPHEMAKELMKMPTAPTPPAQEGVCTLTISSEPTNPTRFKRGDRIEYDKKTGVTSGPMLVIGEDETHLHTFFTEGSVAGSYYGIAKKPENLEHLVTPPAQEDEPVGYISQSMIDGLKAGKRVQYWILPNRENADPDYSDINLPIYTRPQSKIAQLGAEQFEFQVRDRVEKFTGDYKLEGIVVGHAVTIAGHVRYVVEHRPLAPGMLHIYGGNNIRPKVGE